MKRRLAVLALVAAFVALGAAGAVPPALAQSGGTGYLIGAAAPLTAGQVRELEAAGAQLKYVYRNFGGAAALLTSRDVARVRALPFVTSVGEDTVKQLDSVTLADSPLPNEPYWLDLMDEDATTQTAYTGAGVQVAVLDSGFYPNWRDYFDPARIRTDLAMAFVGVIGNANQNQWDVGSDPHGMAVAATIVGYRLRDKPGEGGFGTGYATGAAGTYSVPGVAPDAQIIPVKVCEPIGCFGSAINAGVDYITSLKKANPLRPIVINESLGGARLDPVEKAAIDAAIKAGVVIVASAGNSGPVGMGFPGAYEPVIGVGAGGWKGQWDGHRNNWWLDEVPENGVTEVYVAGFSSREKTGQYLDIVSAGRYLLLPYPCAQLYKDGQVTEATNHRTCASKATPDSAQSAPFQYLHISGTSFSSPAIAGVVALMLQKKPTLNNADAATGTLGNPASWGAGALEKLLEKSATEIPAPGRVMVTHRDGTKITETWDATATGHGWVFIDDALNAVQAENATGRGRP